MALEALADTAAGLSSWLSWAWGAGFLVGGLIGFRVQARA